MTDSDTAIEKLIEKIELYGKKSLELSKLKITQHTIVVFTSLVSYSGIFILLFLFILMLSVSVSFFIGELLGKLSYGFLIVSGFYMIVFITCYFFLHKSIKRPLANLIIKKIFKKI